MKLSTKISGIITSVSVVLLITGSFFTYQSIIRIQRDSIGQQQLVLAKSMIEKIDRFLFEKLINIQAIAEDEEFEGSVAGKEDTQESMAKLNELSLLSGPWDILSLIDTKETIIMSTNKKEIGKKVGEYESTSLAYSQALAGKIYVSDFVYSERSQKPTIIFAAPVRDEETPGAPIIGAAIGHLSWPAIVDILQNTESSQAAIFLINEDGLLLGSSEPDDREYLFKKKFGKFEQLDLRNGVNRSFILPKEAGFHQQEALAAIAWEPGFIAYKGNGWGLLIQEPTAVAFAPGRSVAMRLNMLLMFLIIPAFLLILFLIWRAVLHPLQQLTSTARAIAQGQTKERMPVRSNDEVGILSTAFNDMVSKLEQSKIDLEKKSADLARTSSEINDRNATLEKNKTAMINLLEDLHSAQAKVDEEMRNARKFQQAVEASSDSIAITLPNLEYIYVNRTYEKLTGYAQTDVLGKTPQLLWSDKTEKQLIDKLLQLPQKKAEYTTEEALFHSEDLIYKRKDGTEYNADLSVYPIQENGKTILFVFVHRDITLRKRSDQARSEFISLASHQLRTPITAMRLAIGAIARGQMGVIPDAAKETLDRAKEYVVNMAETVRTMLNISRLEEGTLQPANSDVELASLLEVLHREFQEECQRKEQSFSLTCPPDLTCTTDQALLREVLTNLVSNAVKYTPAKGSIAITVNRETEGIRIDITDSGYGIPLDQQSKIFTKFFRAHNVVKTKTEGTGLGLYLVQSIVRLLGGAVSFTSVEQKGTIFTVRLPLSPSTHV